MVPNGLQIFPDRFADFHYFSYFWSLSIFGNTEVEVSPSRSERHAQFEISKKKHILIHIFRVKAPDKIIRSGLPIAHPAATLKKGTFHQLYGIFHLSGLGLMDLHSIRTTLGILSF